MIIVTILITAMILAIIIIKFRKTNLFLITLALILTLLTRCTQNVGTLGSQKQTTH